MFAAISKSGLTIKPGYIVTSFRGERWTFNSVSRHPGGPSTGRVSVSRDGHSREFYPGVFGLTIVSRPEMTP